MTDENPKGPQSSSRRRELGADLLRYLPSQAIPALISFVTIPILTRLLDPTSYGDYRLVLGAVGVFGAAAVWLPAGIYRFFPELELQGRIGEFRTTINRLLWATAAFFAVLWGGGLAVLWDSLPRNLGYIFLIGLFLMVVNTIWSVANGMIRTLRRVTAYSFAVSLNKALTLGIGVGLVVWTGMEIDGLIFGSIVGSAVLLPFLVFVSRRHLEEEAGSFDSALARSMLRYGYPVALMMMATWLLELSDRYIIAALRGSGEVGLYSAAYGIAEQGMQLILLMFQLPFAILGNRVWERDGSDAAASFVSNSARAYLLLAIPALVGISVLANPIMALMTDAAYREAAVIMPLVAGALLFGGLQWWFSTGSTFVKKTGQQAISVFVGVAINTGLNLLLVGEFGYRIAAVTTLIAYVAAMTTMALLSRREFVWRFPLASTARSLGASGLMAIAIIVLFQTTALGPAMRLAVGVPLGLITYGVGLILLREPEAMNLVRRYISR